MNTPEIELQREGHMYAWDCPECGTRVASRYLPGPDSLDAAWAEAEAALPEGWWGPSIGPEKAIEGLGPWRAFAWDRFTPRGRLVTGHGPTPAAALRALAARLRERAG